jgi:hypothetical protein
VEAGSIYVCIERGCVEAGAGATSGHLQRRGGGRIGPIAASLGSDGGGLAPDSKGHSHENFIGQKTKRNKGLID